MASRRTTMYSTGGKKLYAVRNADGTFKDIQTYKRAHGADMRHKSAAEKLAAVKKRGEEEAGEEGRQGRKKSRQESTATRKTARKAAKKTSRKK